MNRNIGTTRSGLRLGYTSGSCAAGAAKAAARMLLGQEEIRQVRLMTPKGIELYLDLEKITRNDTYAECAVRKYSGDDPDVTDGLLVFVRAEKAAEPSLVRSPGSYRRRTGGGTGDQTRTGTGSGTGSY